MVVIDQLPGVRCFIRVLGQETDEYDDEDGMTLDEDGRQPQYTSHKYIEAKDDAEFSVHCELDWAALSQHLLAPCNALVFRLYVDGDHMQGRVAHPHRSGTTTINLESRRVQSKSRGLCDLLKYKFSAITKVDDIERSRVERDVKVAQKLGFIQVKVFRFVETGSCAHKYDSSTSGIKPSQFSEKAFKGKAISHGTSFSQAGQVPEGRAVDGYNLDDGRPLAAFNFQYRSREALYEELIIPRPHLSSPSSVNLDHTQENVDQQETKTFKSKQESRTPARIPTGNGNSTVKREFIELDNFAPKREWKYIKLENGKRVVDLTEDD